MNHKIRYSIVFYLEYDDVSIRQYLSVSDSTCQYQIVPVSIRLYLSVSEFTKLYDKAWSDLESK